MKIQNLFDIRIPNELEKKPFKKQRVIPRVPKSVYGGLDLGGHGGGPGGAGGAGAGGGGGK